MNAVKMFENACMPAKLYVLFSLITILGVVQQTILGKITPIGGIFSIIIKVAILFLWTYFLNYLCKTGHTGIAWVILFFPIILFFIIIFGIFFYLYDKNKSKNKK